MIGTPHPFVFEDADPAGRWVVACQAREDTNGDGKTEVRFGQHGEPYGDRLVPWLIQGDGPGEAVDAWLGADPSGRWVGFVREGRVWLLDTRSGVRVALDADARDDGSPFGGHRALTFDPAGGRALALRDGAVVIRDLASGAETTRPLPGAWRAAFAPGGHLAAWVVDTDTDGDGALEWPTARTSLGPRACRGPITSYSVQGWDGDRPREVLLPPSGEPVPADDVAAVVSAGVVRRSPDGALTGPGGVPWTDAACVGMVVASWRDRALLSCSRREGALVLVGPGGPRELGIQAPTDAPSEERRLAPLGDVVVDVETGRTHAGWVLATWEGRALLAEKGQLLAWDADTDRTTALGPFPGEGPDARAQGPMVAVTGWGMVEGRMLPGDTVLVDLSGPRALGRVDGEVLSVATDGRALVLPSHPERRESPVGPARWVAPR